MKRSRAIFLALGLAMLVAVQAISTSRLLSRDGARIQWPEPGSRHALSFSASGDAWMAPGPSGISGLWLQAWDEDKPGSSPLSFPAVRPVVTDRGRPLFPLATWSAKASLPSAGNWVLRLVAVGQDGRRIASAPRTMVAVDSGELFDSGFSSWSAPHLAAIAAIVALALLVAYFARKGGVAWLEKAAPFIALAMWLNELAYQSYWMAVGGWSQSVSLMIQMCGLSIVCLPICLFMKDGPRRTWLADVLYFWGIAGAAQAILTPDIGASGFPSYRYFSFFISHGLIIAAVVALFASGAARITKRSLGRCLIASNLVLIPVYAIDRLLALIPPYIPGNYFALGYPPPTGSPIDLLVSIFGPSPRYIVGLEIMGFLVFLLLWLPWAIADRPSSGSA